MIEELRILYFDFDFSKDVGKNLQHETESMTKSNKSLAQDKIKSHIEQLLYKYKHGNNIYEQGTQQNE